MTTQNLWDAAKAVLRGKFIAIQSYLKKQGKHQIDNLILCLKQLEKEKQTKKISGWKEIIKIWAEINEKEMKETIVKINKTKSWVLWEYKQNQLAFSQTHQGKKREEPNQQIRNEKGEVTTDNAEIQRIVRDYYEQL